jgi:hypothetical protein
MGGCVMAWVRIDDGFPDHPKALQAGPMACWLYVCGIAYANRYLTDGFIPERQVHRLIDAKKPEVLTAALVDAGLWEVSEGGYQIHDYLDYQSSSEKVTADREATRKRVEAYRDRKSGQYTNGSANVTPLLTRYESVSNEDVTPAPINIPRKKHSSSVCASAETYPEDFEAFWSAYPRKRSKGDALKAWQVLRPDAALLARMLDAIEVSRKSEDWREERGKYVPYPASWLRAAGWLDVPGVDVTELRPAFSLA